MSTELSRFDRPVFFENDSEDDFPYSVGGSAFVVSMGGQFKVVTAKHCLLSRTASDMLVPVFSNGQHISEEFLPICRVHYGKTNVDEADWYFADVMVLDVDVTKLESSENRIVALPFDDSWNIPQHLKDNDTLVVRGHPRTLREVDYERRVIKQQAFLITGRFRSKSIGKHMHFMEFDDLNAIDDPDGMSGTPVFHQRENQYELAGMIIRGSIEAGGCHFVDRRAIYKVISLASK